jgi:tetratricopeptide (TPR) repeat protein
VASDVPTCAPAIEFKDKGIRLSLVQSILDRARDLQDKLTGSDQTSPDLQRSEVVALGALADTLVTRGDFKRALEAAERALQVAERLLNMKSSKVGLERELELTRRGSDLANCYDIIGDILDFSGRGAEALAAYQQSLTIRRLLAQSDPGNPTWQGGLASGLRRVGEHLVPIPGSCTAATALLFDYLLGKRAACV